MFTRIEKLMISVIITAAVLAVLSMFLKDPAAEAYAAEQYMYTWEPIETPVPEYNIEKFSNPVLQSGDDAVPPFVGENGEVVLQTSDIHSSAVVPASQDRLTKTKGVFNGPSGKETWYSLDMRGVIKIMRNLGYSEEEYPYWVRDDGAKMFGPYVMCAANLELRPRGTIVETSLGSAIVCDTGSFCKKDKTAVDLAVSWK